MNVSLTSLLAMLKMKVIDINAVSAKRNNFWTFLCGYDESIGSAVATMIGFDDLCEGAVAVDDIFDLNREEGGRRGAKGLF